MVKEYALKNGAFNAVLCDHWAKGGLGAVELADAVIAACDSASNFQFLYSLDLSIQDKIKKIATEMYGAGKIEYTDEVIEKIKQFTEMVSSIFVHILSIIEIKYDPIIKTSGRLIAILCFNVCFQ